ncbi:MAG: NADH-quinone oxidoreductase subunit I [Deltaproteobacteria bacterium]|nr:NADH-quinone oxidoreductase subunit I [Deltaproteobacteria bacterium]
MIGIKQITRPEKLTLWERVYILEIMRGLFITIRHFLVNLIHPFERMTVEYPEKKKDIPFGYRAEHRLMLRPDGSVRCTACMLCATACPADCISIVAEEAPDPTIEKRAKEYTIDELRCVFCGLWVEACPCDAIRMDTYKYENANYTRRDCIYDKKKLMDNHPEGASPYSIAL